MRIFTTKKGTHVEINLMLLAVSLILSYLYSNWIFLFREWDWPKYSLLRIRVTAFCRTETCSNLDFFEVISILIIISVCFPVKKLTNVFSMSFRLYNNARYKGKVVPIHVMWAYRESRSIAPLILNLDSSWRWVVSFTTHSLYPQEIYRCSKNSMLDGLQSQSWRLEEGKSLVPVWIRTLDHYTT
jgi:hypothetical protein